MLEGPGFDKNFALLEQLMTIASNKQKVIANNIANVNTPGFRRKELKFEEEFLKAVEENDMEAVRQVEGKVVYSDDPTLQNDGNNVDIDKEMGLMNRNSLAYSLYTQLYAKKLDMLQLAMRST
ncbi:MAG: flagellar basal body rod protein FlgB [Candidatus Aminicenantes bacterium]|nr:flagellar basal body rod protein FlgB [Candidatus Aminicenantes bacterium]